MRNSKWLTLLIVTLYIFTVIISGAETRRRNTKLFTHKPAGRKLIISNLLALIYNIFNSNTSIESLNNLVTSFDTTVNSPGFIALDTFFNTIENGFDTYDAIGNGIEGVIDLSQKLKEKKEAQHNEEEDIVQEFKSSRDEMATKLTSIESKIKCRLFKLVTRRQPHQKMFPENCIIVLSTMR